MFAKIRRKYNLTRCERRSRNGFPPRDPDSVHLILADSRSGSTLLMDHLSCHPENTEVGELFGLDAPLSKDPSAARQIAFLNCMFATSATRQTGCKITFTQLIRNTEAVPLLSAFRESRLVWLERRDPVASAVSLLRAQATGEYHRRKAHDHAQQRIRVNPVELRMLIDLRVAFRETVRHLVRGLGITVLQATYEKLIADTPGTVAEILKFIGLEPVHTVSCLEKVAPRGLNEIIENFDEVRNHLADTPYSEYVS